VGLGLELVQGLGQAQVHVVGLGAGDEITAAGLEGDLSLVAVLFDAENDMNIDDIVQIGRHLVQTLLGGGPQRIRNFDVATRENDLHRGLL
jgi:hypothetical protein